MYPEYFFKGENFKNRFDLFDYIVKNKIDENDEKNNIASKSGLFPEETEFKRNKENVDLFELGRKRLLQIKQTGKKFHFWYSGGLDSTFVLECMIRFNIYPDVIHTYMVDPCDRKLSLLHRDEVQKSIDFLDSLNLPSNIERKLWELNSEIFEKCFKLDSYLEYSSIVNYSFIFVTNWYHKIYSDFPLSDSDYHLFGSITPRIMFDGKWKFSFYDYQFEMMLQSNNEYFITSDREFLEAYINNIINTCNSRMKWNQKIIDIQSQNDERFLKKMCPEIVEAGKLIKWEQYSKVVKDPIKTGNAAIDVVTSKFQVKSTHTLMSSIDNNLSWVQDFYNLIKRNEEVIIRDTNFGGILTEVFELK